MKRFHLFYFTILLLVWGWYGNHWWQWRQVEAVTTTPEVAFAVLEQAHQNTLLDLRFNNLHFSMPISEHHWEISLQLDSLFKRVTHGEASAQEFETLALNKLADTDSSKYNRYKAASDFIPILATLPTRTECYLLRDWVDKNCFPGHFFTACEDPLGEFEILNTLPWSPVKVKSTFATDFMIRRRYNCHDDVFVNFFSGQRALVKPFFDTVFTASGAQPIEITQERVTRHFTFKAHNLQTINIVNPSK